jgi:hypothetical protein
MKYIKRLFIKLMLLNALRQLAYMLARKQRYGMHMSIGERAWLNRDIYQQDLTITGYKVWLADLDDNEKETLSSRCVSPLKRLGE